MNSKFFFQYLFSICFSINLFATPYVPENFQLTVQELTDDTWFADGLQVQLYTEKEQVEFIRIEREHVVELQRIRQEMQLSEDQPLPQDHPRVKAAIAKKENQWIWSELEPIILTKEQVNRLQSARLIAFMRQVNDPRQIIDIPLTPEDLNFVLQQLEHPRVLLLQEQKLLLYAIDVLHIGVPSLFRLMHYFSKDNLQRLAGNSAYISWLPTVMRSEHYARRLPWQQNMSYLPALWLKPIFAPNNNYFAFERDAIFHHAIHIWRVDKITQRWSEYQVIKLDTIFFNLQLLSFSPGSKFLYFQFDGYPLNIYLLNELTQQWELCHNTDISLEKGSIYSFSPDDQFFVYSSADCFKIFRFDAQLAQWRPYGDCKKHTDAIENLVFSANSKSLASMSKKDGIKVWALDEASQQWKLENEPTILKLTSRQEINCVDFMSDNTTVVCDWNNDVAFRRSTYVIQLPCRFNNISRKFELIKPQEPFCSPDGVYVIEGHILRPNLDIFDFCQQSSQSSCSIQ